MDRIQPQPVEVVLDQPVQRIVYEEISNGTALRPIEINGIAPWRLMTIGEESWCVRVKIISFRAKMVVHNIEEHHDSPLMRTLYQFFEIFRTSIHTVRSERKDAVVPPIALAGKIGNRHQLYRSDSQVGEIVEAFARGGKSSGRGEGPNMQFINNGLLPRTSLPSVVTPLEGMRGHNFAGSVHVLGLKP